MVSLSEVPELHGTNKGPLRAIAILSKKRSPSLPDVPTAEETGIPITMTAERGFAAPKAVSDEVAKKLEAAIADGLRDPEYLKSSPGDAPVLAFMPGAEWQKRLDDMSQGPAAIRGRDACARAEVRRATLGATHVGSDVMRKKHALSRGPWGGKNLAISMLILAGTISSMLRSSPTEQMRSANAVVRDLGFGRHDRRIWVVCARTHWSAYSKFLRSTTVCAPSNAFSSERRGATTSRDLRHI